MQYDFKSKHGFKSNADAILKARENVLNRRNEIIKKQELEREQSKIEAQKAAAAAADSFIAGIQKFLNTAPETELLSPTINVPITKEQYQLFITGDNYLKIQYRILELGFEFDGLSYSPNRIHTPEGIVERYDFMVTLSYPDNAEILSVERALTYFDSAWAIVEQMLDEVTLTSYPAKGVILNKSLAIPKIIYSALGFDEFSEAIKAKIKENGIHATVERLTRSSEEDGQMSHFLSLAINKYAGGIRLNEEVVEPVVTEEKESWFSKVWQCRNKPNFWTAVMSLIFLCLFIKATTFPK